MEALELGIAHDEPVVGVPHDEGLGDRLDRVAQAHVRRGGARLQRHRLRDVDGDPDEVAGAVRVFPHQLRPGTEPYPIVFHRAQAKDMVDRRRRRLPQLGEHRAEVTVVVVDEGVDLGHRDGLQAGRHADDLVHGIRPVDHAACEVPVPQAAAAAAQRRVDAVAHPVAQQVGDARARSLPEIGAGERQQNAGGATQKNDHAQQRGVPTAEHVDHWMNDGDLPERCVQSLDGGEHFLLAGEVYAHHPGLVGEDRQRLGCPQMVEHRPAGDAFRIAGDDPSGRIAQQDALLAVGHAGGNGAGEGLSRAQVRPFCHVDVDVVRHDGGHQLHFARGGLDGIVLLVDRKGPSGCDQKDDENDKGADDRAPDAKLPLLGC